MQFPRPTEGFFPIITLKLSHLIPMGYPRPHQPSRRSQDITSDPGTTSPRIVIWNTSLTLHPTDDLTCLLYIFPKFLLFLTISLLCNLYPSGSSSWVLLMTDKPPMAIPEIIWSSTELLNTLANLLFIHPSSEWVDWLSLPIRPGCVFGDILDVCSYAIWLQNQSLSK